MWAITVRRTPKSCTSLIRHVVAAAVVIDPPRLCPHDWSWSFTSALTGLSQPGNIRVPDANSVCCNDYGEEDHETNFVLVGDRRLRKRVDEPVGPGASSA